MAVSDGESSQLCYIYKDWKQTKESGAPPAAAPPPRGRASPLASRAFGALAPSDPRSDSSRMSSSRRNGSVSRAAEAASKNRLHMDRNPQHSRITDPSNPAGRRKEIDNVMKRARQASPGSWDRKLLQVEEKDPNRWRHTGYKQMYLDGSRSPSPSPRRSRSANRRSRSPARRSRSPLRRSRSPVPPPRRAEPAPAPSRREPRRDARRSPPPPARRRSPRPRSPPPRPRDPRDARDSRDVRDPRDTRDTRDVRDVRDVRDPRDARDTRDVRRPRPRPAPPPAARPPSPPDPRKSSGSGSSASSCSDESCSVCSAKNKKGPPPGPKGAKPPTAPAPAPGGGGGSPARARRPPASQARAVQPTRELLKAREASKRTREEKVLEWQRTQLAVHRAAPAAPIPAASIKREGERRRRGVSPAAIAAALNDSDSDSESDASSEQPQRLTLSERFGKMAQWSADRSARLENMRITRRDSALHVRIERGEGAAEPPAAEPYPGLEAAPVGSYPEELLAAAPGGLPSWDDVRVRYDYYKKRGYLRGLTLSDYVKWEEWWYKYQEWLKRERAYERWAEGEVGSVRRERRRRGGRHRRS